MMSVLVNLVEVVSAVSASTIMAKPGLNSCGPAKIVRPTHRQIFRGQVVERCDVAEFSPLRGAEDRHPVCSAN